jgi:hypothetical protein
MAQNDDEFAFDQRLATGVLSHADDLAKLKRDINEVHMPMT